MNAGAEPVIEGPSFPIFTKVLALAAVLATGWLSWLAREQLLAMDMPPELVLLAGLAGAVVLGQLASILFSRTGVSRDAVWQGWLWRSHVPLSEITQVKLLRFKPLDPVVAPRLVVRAGATGNRTFHMADPKVLLAVDVLVHGRKEPNGDTN